MRLLLRSDGSEDWPAAPGGGKGRRALKGEVGEVAVAVERLWPELLVVL